MNTDGNVTYTFIRLHASIALESWILKVRIIHRFPLFYTSKGMKSLTDIKSLHPCGWTEELSMPHPPTPLVGKAGVYIPLLSISFIRFYFTSFFFILKAGLKACPICSYRVLFQSFSSWQVIKYNFPDFNFVCLFVSLFILLWYWRWWWWWWWSFHCFCCSSWMLDDICD